ncbi:SigB/SigF/SigG family RNA polymerase sigma factor [Mycolicibacterium iranicum]|uniref:RNA polymerase subunit sigma n=1 Tax=Mycolicibacterium iranicum TaxID=912594 RepID=A0A178LP83_MYCIR|nr:SigB/SigF/SigG family RNA polymerase sigma factor [Mycolicibacterium iranicum]OAN33577.1 hypothetical protein A4X20_27840 [Mycolicibacterium iranicum]
MTAPPRKESAHDGYSDTDAYADVDEDLARLTEVVDDEERQRIRLEIVARCLPLADQLARRFAGRGEPSDDLVQVARLGLLKVVDRFDPEQGRFVGFAVPSILGELRRHFRDNTWAMRVPRRVKDNHILVRDATASLSQRLGRSPTASELAEELDVDREEVLLSMQAVHAYRPLSLDMPIPGSDSAGQTLAAMQGAEDPRYDTIEDAMIVAELMTELPARERSILRMRFCECLTQTEIAKALDISQVHVSRLLSATLDRLRTRMWSEAPTLLPVLMALPIAA